MLCRSGFVLNCEPHVHLIAFVVRISMLDNLCIQLLETDWLDSKEITIEIVEQHWNMIKMYCHFFKKSGTCDLVNVTFYFWKISVNIFSKKAPPLRYLWLSVQYQFPILKVEQHPFPVSQMNSFKMPILTCSDLVLFTKSTGSFKLCVFFHIVFLCSKNLPQWEQWNGFTSFHPRDMKGHYLPSQQAFANSVVNVTSLGWKLWWNHSTAPIVAKVSNATTQWTMQEHTTSKS